MDNLTRISTYTNPLGSLRLRLEGVMIGIGEGCFVRVVAQWVVYPILVVEVPKTQVPASLVANLVRGPSCTS